VAFETYTRNDWYSRRYPDDRLCRSDDILWSLVGEVMMCIYNSQLGVEMNDMYDVRIDMNRVAEIDDYDVVDAAPWVPSA